MINQIKKTAKSALRALTSAVSAIKNFTVEIGRKAALLFGYKKQKTNKYNITPKDISVANTSNSRINRARKMSFWKSKVFILASAVTLAATITAVIVLAGSDSKPETALALALVNEKGAAAEDTQRNDRQQVSNDDSSSNASVQDQQVSASTQSATESIPTTTPASTPIATTEPVEKELVPGVNDSRVIDIQQRLMDLGYMDMDEPTDYYGYGTEYALQLFQRKHNLQVDGIVGDITLELLYSDEAMPYTVKLGDRGTDVASLQKRLQSLNYLKAGSTGYFGTDTEAAVKAFQQRNGLYADGNVGEQTREALFADGARAAKTSSGGSSSGGGGSSTGNQPVVVGDPDDASADALIDFALTQLGKPYVRGGKGPKTFDCSGFVYYSLNSVGHKINYMTSTAWRSANYPTINNFEDVKKGDILCFNGHVGIYMGNGKMIDASSSNGKIVTRSNISSSSYWTKNFRCAKRVF